VSRGKGGRARGRKKRRERERERGGEGSSPRGPNSGDRRLQFLGHHGEREVEERERGGCCAGDPNEREREEGRMGGGVGARGAQGRAGLGWVGLGHFAGRKPTACTTTKWN
jgi:hypothetical protein